MPSFLELSQRSPSNEGMSETAHRRSDDFWNLPNLITLSRLPMAVALWFLPRGPVPVLGLMLLSGFSDMLDGWVARGIRAGRERRGEPLGNLGGPQASGAWLDPVCDKTFVVSVLVLLVVYYEVPTWMVLLVATRELIQGPMFVLYRVIPSLRERILYDYRAAIIGKVTTVLQFLAVGAILFDLPSALTLAVVTGCVGALTGFYYSFRRAKQGQRE
jgi:phosphatidylglycerophosphate synthase